MAAFRSGTTYTLKRKQSRDIEINAVVSWETKSRETGKVVEHCLFSMGPRQASKYGKATAPKLLKGGNYQVERPDEHKVAVRLYRQEVGEGHKRFLWTRRVGKGRQ